MHSCLRTPQFNTRWGERRIFYKSSLLTLPKFKSRIASLPFAPRFLICVSAIMTLSSRISALLLTVAAIPASFAQPVDVWTVGVNNTRQGWNKFETVLTPATVPRLKKIREFIVDEKIDVSPLVVGDKLYVFSMTTTAYIFNVNTGAQIVTRQLVAPFDPRPDPGQMDRWKIYHNWGITASPVIDVATGTIYVTTFGRPNATSPTMSATTCFGYSTRTPLPTRSRRCLSLAMPTTAEAAIANGFTTPYQKMRAGLGLLTDSRRE